MRIEAEVRSANQDRMEVLHMLAHGIQIPEGCPPITYDAAIWPLLSPSDRVRQAPDWRDVLLSNEEYRHIVAHQDPARRCRQYRSRRAAEFCREVQEQRWLLRQKTCSLLDHSFRAHKWDIGHAIKDCLRGEYSASKALLCAKLFELGFTSIDQRANRYLIQLRALAQAALAPPQQGSRAIAQSA